ncbi:MAG: amino acid adenylation domain-containing protein, partial [Chloroflexota bacterium]|nr:amino acid adenylation domain-containing protein [Chloroflexota bacterium]
VPEYHIEVLDLRAAEPAMAEATLTSMRNRLSHEVRETGRWPLFEICAARLDAHRVRVYYSFDLLIADAFSLLLLARESMAQYNNPSAALEPPALSFRDYVLAEAALVGSEPHRRSVEYWRRRLPELPPPPELVLSKPLAAVRHPRFVRRAMRLEPQRWQRLRRRAEQAGLTPTTVVLCAFADVIAAWSKSSRFTLNLTLLNRMPVHEQVNHVVGDFTGVELLGIDNSIGETFKKRAARVQRQLWDDLDHRHIGGVHLIRELARAEEARGAAIMPVVFTSTLNLGGAQADSLPFADGGTPVFGVTQTPQVWLDCGVFQHAGSLLVTWDVVEELFPEGMLVDVFSAFGAVLEGLADNESAWSKTRGVALPAWQRRQRDLINTTAAQESDELLHSPFLAQAARQPEAPAVITPTRTLSYREVHQRSLDLAHELRRRGAQPNELVAVVMEKGWEQVIATQGILQAGAAYLPIDPDLPRERLWYLLEHGQVRIAVTQARVDHRLVWPDCIQRLHVEGDAPRKHLEPLEPIQTPGDLAYVIFTSGSTGVPKGVMIDHRGALNTLLDLNERFCVGPEDRVFAFSSLSFDLSVYDIFGTLAAGGAIVMPDAAGLRDPAHWSELLHRGRVTLWNSVPALMQMLVDYAADRQLALPESLRMVWLSGDWIPVSLPDRIKVLRPGVQVISMGGATEASIWSILYPVERVEREWKSIPYGKPLRNQTFHVLDAALQPRPVWVPGELYIGGVGVAKGYWRDEVKTRAKFIVHAETGERLYRTGDLGRYLPDGNIEFLGREDFQVKIQGFRVELGEIEAVLAQHPEVLESVVVAQDGVTTGAGKRLLAYVVLADGATSAQAALRDFVAAKLPAYMVPADWMILPSLPLTSNGKVDRRSLPSPDRSRVELRQTYVAPRDQLESELAEIWAQALGVRPIGITNNFFDLGGHSLLAALIFGEITSKYGRELPLTTLFRGPTIAELAVILRAQPRQLPWSPVVAIQATGSRPPFFCLHSAGGNVLEYYPLATRLGPDQPFYALQAQGLDGGPTGPDRLEDMAAQYLAAIRTVQPSGSYHLGGFCLGGLLALEVAQQLRAAGEDVALVVMIETPTGGYGQPLPHTTALERLTHRARQRVELELGNLAPLEPRARMAHGLKRVHRLLTLGWTNLEKATDPLFARVPDRQYSHARALDALTAAHGRAYDNYVPRGYPGRVVLFRASEQPWGIIPDPTMGWDGLIPVESEIFEVPGRHKNILAEPYVRSLAERLHACLEPAANQLAVRQLLLPDHAVHA